MTNDMISTVEGFLDTRIYDLGRYRLNCGCWEGVPIIVYYKESFSGTLDVFECTACGAATTRYWFPEDHLFSL
jgi:hypothetical protein